MVLEIGLTLGTLRHVGERMEEGLIEKVMVDFANSEVAKSVEKQISIQKVRFSGLAVISARDIISLSHLKPP